MSWFSKGTFVKGRGEGHSGMFIVCTMYVLCMYRAAIWGEGGRAEWPFNLWILVISDSLKHFFPFRIMASKIDWSVYLFTQKKPSWYCLEDILPTT